MKKSGFVIALILLILIIPFALASSSGFFYKIKNFFSEGTSANVIGEGYCTDSDGGSNIYIKGTVTDASGNTATDACYIVSSENSFRVHEKGCDVYGNLVSDKKNCEYGCFDGRCLNYEERYIFNSCSDSDTNVNVLANGPYSASEVIQQVAPSNSNDAKYVKGTTTGYTKEDINTLNSFTDYCSNSYTLKEYACYSYPYFSWFASPPMSIPLDVYVVEKTFGASGTSKCPHGCSNGACIEEGIYYSCTKTGKVSTSTYDRYFRDAVVENDIFYEQKTDYCINSQNLKKYSCYAQTYKPAAGKINSGQTIICKYGCSDGICMSVNDPNAIIPQLENGWTPWYNLDDSSDGSDIEYHSGWNVLPDDCSKIIDIECQTASGIDYHQTGEVVSCDYRTGLYCKAVNQQNGVCVNDYKIRYKCQVSTDTSSEGTESSEESQTTQGQQEQEQQSVESQQQDSSNFNIISSQGFTDFLKNRFLKKWSVSQ